MFLTESGVAVFATLEDLLLEIAQERELDSLLPLIVRRIVESSAAMARARIWLLGPGDSCAECFNANVCASREQCLHLVASATRPIGAPVQMENSGAAALARVPIGTVTVGALVSERKSLVTDVVDSDLAHPAWLEAEHVQSFVGQPLLYRGHALGVLGVFGRARLGTSEAEGVRVLANHSAAAIAGARAFAEASQRQIRLQRENDYLRAVATSSDDFTTIVGSSPAIYHVKRQIDLVAPTDATVLVSGEAGTGKELVAEAIHRRSRRAGEAFVRMNCAAIPRELYDSEFFGHAKGAFSGAVRDRVGRIEAAEGGTLFLDDISEIPLDLQGKLVHALHEGTFERLGETRARRANVRVIAATQRDLTREVAQDRFRQDLYFRLNVFPIEMPSLREHREDIAVIALHLVSEICRRMHREPPTFEPEALRELEAHDWPGNVRELRNVIEQAIIATPHGAGRLALPRVGPARDSAGPRSSTRIDMVTRSVHRRTVVPEADVRRFERENLLAALEMTGGRVYGRGGAADLLGVKPTTLASRLKKLGIAPRS